MNARVSTRRALTDWRFVREEKKLGSKVIRGGGEVLEGDGEEDGGGGEVEEEEEEV